MSIYDGTPLQAEFDALEPTPEMWANAPDDALVYAIDADGLAHWFSRQDNYYPYPNELGYWIGKQCEPKRPIRTDIPLGIDWRLCKWSREVTA